MIHTAIKQTLVAVELQAAPVLGCVRRLNSLVAIDTSGFLRDWVARLLPNLVLVLTRWPNQLELKNTIRLEIVQLVQNCVVVIRRVMCVHRPRAPLANSPLVRICLPKDKLPSTSLLLECGQVRHLLALPGSLVHEGFALVLKFNLGSLTINGLERADLGANIFVHAPNMLLALEQPSRTNCGRGLTGLVLQACCRRELPERPRTEKAPHRGKAG